MLDQALPTPAPGDPVPERNGSGAGTMPPSALYQSQLWRLGLGLVGALPPRLSRAFSISLASLYAQVVSSRRRIVTQNLLVPLEGDLIRAHAASSRLFREFAVKLTDLWRYEAGQPIQSLFSHWTGFEHLQAAQAKKRGLLLLTPHLGNWEFGAPLLIEKGIQLLVVTLEEPDACLTELRKRARARHGVETLVIGSDPFAFVEIIRRLEGGATVALLVDRPPARSAVRVELFGRPFAASVAGAELARATGCTLLPVYLPRARAGYEAHVMPEIGYDRAALRSPQARQQLTQEILRAFAPAIRHNLEQWYHFVPIWPD